MGQDLPSQHSVKHVPHGFFALWRYLWHKWLCRSWSLLQGQEVKSFPFGKSINPIVIVLTSPVHSSSPHSTFTLHKEISNQTKYGQLLDQLAKRTIRGEDFEELVWYLLVRDTLTGMALMCPPTSWMAPMQERSTWSLTTTFWYLTQRIFLWLSKIAVPFFGWLVITSDMTLSQWPPSCKSVGRNLQCIRLKLSTHSKATPPKLLKQC